VGKERNAIEIMLSVDAHPASVICAMHEVCHAEVGLVTKADAFPERRRAEHAFDTCRTGANAGCTNAFQTLLFN
jgi:hypothetical protein